jgi:hypothetical protein
MSITIGWCLIKPSIGACNNFSNCIHSTKHSNHSWLSPVHICKNHNTTWLKNMHWTWYYQGLNSWCISFDILNQSGPQRICYCNESCFDCQHKACTLPMTYKEIALLNTKYYADHTNSQRLKPRADVTITCISVLYGRTPPLCGGKGSNFHSIEWKLLAVVVWSVEGDLVHTQLPLDRVEAGNRCWVRSLELPLDRVEAAAPCDMEFVTAAPLDLWKLLFLGTSTRSSGNFLSL